MSTIGLTPGQELPVEALYRKYSREVLSVARRSTACRADAEDVSQTAFMNAHKALLHGVKPVNERAWLLAIARNVCRKRIAFAMTHPREEPLDEAMLATAPESSAARDLEEALARLLPRHRLALSLHDLEGRPRHEVEERLGSTGAALDALLFRARRALRDELSAGEEPLGCHESRTLVKLHLERELGARELGRLRAHLRTCGDCATAARQLRARRRLPFWWSFLLRLLPRGGRVAGGLKVAGTVGALVVAGSAGVVSTPTATSPLRPRVTAHVQHSVPPATTVRQIHVPAVPAAPHATAVMPPPARQAAVRVSVPTTASGRAQPAKPAAPPVPSPVSTAPEPPPPPTGTPPAEEAPADTPGEGAVPGAPAGAATVSTDVSPADVAATASVDAAAGPVTVAATATVEVTGTAPTPGDVADTAARAASDVESVLANTGVPTPSVTAQVTGSS